MSADKQCFFCYNECRVDALPSLSCSKIYCCSYCGQYLLDLEDSARLSGREDDKFKIACVLNERRLKGSGGVALSNKTDMNREVLDFPGISIDAILSAFPSKASDFFDRTLLNLSRLPKKQPFEVISLNLATNRDGLHLFIPDQRGCEAFLGELAEQGYIRFQKGPTGSIKVHIFSLTAKFWEIIEKLQREEVGNKRAFVAMWFDKSMDDYYKDGIEKAVEEADYIPVRIDLQEFNNKICDEIIAEIKRTKFLVADFSGLRSGVFFEAGFAKGLGMEVIFTVRQEDVEALKEHFDTRQYNHIVYDSPEDLRKKLYNRIGATIV